MNRRSFFKWATATGAALILRPEPVEMVTMWKHAQPGLTEQPSVHVRFDHAETRFRLKVKGPPPNIPLSYSVNGGPFVRLLPR